MSRFTLGLLLGVPWGAWGCWRLYVSAKVVDRAREVIR